MKFLIHASVNQLLSSNNGLTDGWIKWLIDDCWLKSLSLHLCQCIHACCLHATDPWTSLRCWLQYGRWSLWAGCPAPQSQLRVAIPLILGLLSGVVCSIAGDHFGLDAQIPSWQFHLNCHWSLDLSAKSWSSTDPWTAFRCWLQYGRWSLWAGCPTFSSQPNV